MPFTWYDPTMLLLIPAFIFSLWAQIKTQSTFKKYSEVLSSRRVTADEVAGQILRTYGINNVQIEMVNGELTDHYDPMSRKLCLSQSVYGNSSIAAIGVAAHEAGHAIQHAKGYGPISVRNAIVPLANITSNLAIPLFFLGLILSMGVLLKIGILLFTGAVAFHLVTLPVEINASSRALKVLQAGSFLDQQELKGARAVLTAAAMTYLAAALMAILNLARMLLIARNRE